MHCRFRAAVSDSLNRNRGVPAAARAVPLLLALALFGGALACESGEGGRARARLRQRIEPTYSRETGQLTAVAYDADGDGKAEARAFLNGDRVERVEVDQNSDARVDRWEYYVTGAAISRPGVNQPPPPPVLARVDEDTDHDGRVDKWETYAGGELATLAFDLQRRGKPDQRLVYRVGGTLERVEADPDGDGDFQISFPQR